MSALTQKEIQRFLSYMAIEPNSGCWLWEKSLGSHGYGQFVASQTPYTAHRLSLELHKGPAPFNGAHALHKCNVRSCCNPDHLYWGTQADNARDRTNDGTARNRNTGRTSCSNGHALTPDNTYVTPSNGFRRCRECRRAWERKANSGQTAPNDAPPVHSAA